MPRTSYLVAVPAVALALAMAACAPTAPKDPASKVAETGRRCAFAETVSGYSVKDDTLYLSAGNRVYQVEAAAFCPDLESGISLGFRTHLGSSQVCVGDWIDVIASDTSVGSGVCRARVSNILSRQEVAALPDNLRPR